jgi:Asp-tRNA(Asn)/Glu-tRNA(Gln) amidotransferase A subunit family amidase
MTRSAVLVLTIVLLAGAGWPAAQGRRTAPEPPLAAFDVMEKSIEDLQRAMQAGAVTSRQLVDLYLARIAAYDQGGPTLNAITVLNPQARSTAEALDAERQSGRVRGPLHGIPVLVKDNYETVEMPTSAGSIALAGFHPARDATLVKKLKDAGAVVLGKTNMHELAAGIVTVGSRFGQTRNPYDLDRNPGGSSGGTGAAVAANFAAAGMGSDTCGSIRIPAANNNLVGLRGTQGLSSRTGIVPLSTTQDIGGPIARSIADLALMLDATVGADPSDPSTAESAAHIPPSYRAMLGDASLQGARIGVVRELIGDAPEDQEVAAVLNRSLEALKKAGVTAIDVTVPGLNELLRDSSMIAFDFKFDLADYLRKDGHAPVASLGEILERGLYHSALESTFRLRNATESRDNDQSRRARIKRVALRQALEAVLAEHQLTALVYPSLRRKPARIGDAQLGTQCQVSAHSGLPALGLPAGFSDDEVPVGMELLGGAYKEVDLLKLGAAIEKTLALRRPPFSTPPLVAGRRPAARGMTAGTAPAATGASPRGVADPAVVTFSYDVTTSRLGYTLDAVAAPVVAVWLHSGTPDKPGAARHQLYRAPAPAERSGTVVLSAADRRDIAAGRFMVRVYSAGAAPLDRALTFR